MINSRVRFGSEAAVLALSLTHSVVKSALGKRFTQ